MTGVGTDLNLESERINYPKKQIQGKIIFILNSFFNSGGLQNQAGGLRSQSYPCNFCIFFVQRDRMNHCLIPTMKNSRTIMAGIAPSAPNP